MLLSDFEERGRGPTPGPLTGVCGATIWRHIVSKEEFLELDFGTDPCVVVDKERAGHLLQVLCSWMCPGVDWPPGAYPGPTGIRLFDGELPKELNDDPF